MKSQLNKQVVLLAATLCCLAAGAQTQPRYKAELENIASASFYKINLSPALVGYCREDLQDIRIIETGTGRQMPYMLKSDAPGFVENKFIDFPLLSVKKEADKQTHIIIKANHSGPIDNLLLFIKNTDVIRSVHLSGSDNGSNWFIIKENIYLDEYFNRYSDQFIQTVFFPPSKYGFYRLTIIGENLLPVNITRAGMYTGQVSEAKYQPVAIKSIIQKDSSDKISYIQLQLDTPNIIHKLSLECTGPKYFNRMLNIYPGTGYQNSYASSFRLSSNGSSSFPLEKTIKSGNLRLTIHNDDNVPLTITSATCWQLNQYLLTYLEAGKQYSLHFGDSTATAPVYDLSFFKDSIPSSPAVLTFGSIHENTRPALTKNTGHNRGWMWIVIIAAGIGLLLFTIQLMRQLNKKQT